MSRNLTRGLLIGLQVGYVLFVVVWLFVALMSTMGFNSEEVFKHTFTWLFIAYVLSYPVGLLAALIAGWILFKRHQYRAALLWNVFPLLWILSLAGIIAFA